VTSGSDSEKRRSDGASSTGPSGTGALDTVFRPSHKAVLYVVQVNVPMTDELSVSPSGALMPACFQLLQIWTLTGGSGSEIPGSGGQPKR
jgi:hypothetical protein